MSVLNITPYNWVSRDLNSKFNIHIWGWIASEAVLLRIQNYYPTLYLELPKEFKDTENMIYQLSQVKGILKIEETLKYKLYYYRNTATPFLKLYFDSLANMHNFSNLIKKTGTYNNTSVIIREIDVSPIRKLLSTLKIRYGDTFTVTGTPVSESDKISTLRNEYIINYKDIRSTGEIFEVIPKVLSFRLRLNQSMGVQSINVLVNTGVESKSYDLESKNNEIALLYEFFALIRETDPDLIIGFEIFTKAYKFIGKRIKELGIKFGALGRLKDEDSTIVTSRWKSSAFGYNESHVLATEGRLSIDLYNFIKRTTKLDKYDFESVAKEFKVPLDLNSLSSANSAVLQLFKELDVWIELSELSSIVGVSIDELFTRGEQLRSFSLIYDKASNSGYVIDYQIQPEIDVEGGYQFATDPGVYNNTLWFDFASEYPSIVIAYNIDYTTLVKDEKVPESDLNTILGTNKGGVFATQFVKPEIRKGVLPLLISDLITERNRTKELIVRTGNIRYVKREKILKTSTNAIVGFLGVPEDQGMLSLIDAFMSITYIGRDLTKTANEWIEDNYDAKILYNDTDSLAIELKDEYKIPELYSLGDKIGTQISALFPKPITLKFDGVNKFVLLTAKKYAILGVLKNGEFAEKSVQKGILAIRSDTNAFSANLYSKVLDNILYGKSVKDSINLILDLIIDLESRKTSFEDLAQVKKINTEYAPTSTYFLKKFLDRMSVLGVDIPKGSEVEYVVLDGPEKAIGDRMMLVSLLRATDTYDVVYYADSLINPIDQLLQIGYSSFLNPMITYKPPKSRKRAVGLNEPMKIIALQISAGAKISDLRNWFLQNLI